MQKHSCVRLVHRILSNCYIDLSDFSSAALSSIVVATATPHSSALQLKKSSCRTVLVVLFSGITIEKTADLCGISGLVKVCERKNEKNVKKLLTGEYFGARISLASAVRKHQRQTTTYGEISKWS